MQDGKLKITLNEAPLNDQLGLYAPSHVWGKSTDTKRVIVNGQLLVITQNLYDSLNTTCRYEPSMLAYNGPSSLHLRDSGKTQPAASASSSGLLGSAEK